MKTKYTVSLLAIIVGLAFPLIASADNMRVKFNFPCAGFKPVGQHVGQMDTDGILSPGERRNPDINYYWAQRHAERHGDYRVENPYNDAAAAADRWRHEQKRHWDYYPRDDSRYYEDGYYSEHYWQPW